MKILNLYAGIGGNRKLWGSEHKVTAIENDSQIAKIYQDFFPKDEVIVTDAHQYLLEHYEEFDFIWSSPPCPTHSKMGKLRVLSESKITGSYLSKAKYPDMNLYQEILLLKHYFKGLWCVENVVAFYEPLIRPSEFGGHWFWTNFPITNFSGRSRIISDKNITVKESEEALGFNLTPYKGINKRLLLRNCVEPELGRHILSLAINPIVLQKPMF